MTIRKTLMSVLLPSLVVVAGCDEPSEGASAFADEQADEDDDDRSTGLTYPRMFIGQGSTKVESWENRCAISPHNNTDDIIVVAVSGIPMTKNGQTLRHRAAIPLEPGETYQLENGADWDGTIFRYETVIPGALGGPYRGIKHQGFLCAAHLRTQDQMRNGFGDYLAVADQFFLTH